ncbi:MAG: OmpP1/FadL family transporter, partial [Janthinobacterium lividum]
LGAIALLSDLVFTGSAKTAVGSPIQGTTRSIAGTTALLPNLYATYSLTPELSFGLAVTTPFGTSTAYGTSWSGRYSADKTDLRTLDINPSVAYRVTPWLSLGAGLSVQQVRAVLSSAINASSIASAASGLPIMLPDGYLNLHGTSTAVGYNVGALIEPVSGTRVGLSYRSRVNHVLTGDATFNMPVPLSANPRLSDGHIQTKLVLPDTARISLTQSLGAAWQGYFDIAWTDWSRFKSLNVIRSNGEPLDSNAENYRNSFSVALGTSWRATSRLTLRAGTAFDQSPVQDAFRNPRGPDASRYWLSIGAGYEVLPGTTVDAGYAHVFMPTVEVVSQSPTGDVLRGQFRNSMDLFGLSVRSAF